MTLIVVLVLVLVVAGIVRWRIAGPRRLRRVPTSGGRL